MMHTVMRRRIEDQLKPLGQTLNRPRMDEKLVKQIQFIQQRHHAKIHAQKCKRRPDDKTDAEQRNRCEQRLTQSHTKIKMIRAVVNFVRHPRKAHFVRHHMKQPKTKILENKDQYISPPMILDIHLQTVMLHPRRQRPDK